MTGVEGDTLTVYNPGNGETVHVTRDQYVNGELPFGNPAPPLDQAGPMTEPWFTVVLEVRRAFPLAGLALAARGLQLDLDRAADDGRRRRASLRRRRVTRGPRRAGLIFPSQEYGGANVLRDAGSRSTDYPGLAAAKVARLEIAAALDIRMDASPRWRAQTIRATPPC